MNETKLQRNLVKQKLKRYENIVYFFLKSGIIFIAALIITIKKKKNGTPKYKRHIKISKRQITIYKGIQTTLRKHRSIGIRSQMKRALVICIRQIKRQNFIENNI
jgi:hypothetical protein